MLVNLINEKKNKKITSKQIANLLNTREATISDKLNGKSRFSFDEAITIQKVLDICQLVWLTKNTSYENVGGIFLRKNTIDS